MESTVTGMVKMTPEVSLKVWQQELIWPYFKSARQGKTTSQNRKPTGSAHDFNIESKITGWSNQFEGKPSTLTSGSSSLCQALLSESGISCSAQGTCEVKLWHVISRCHECQRARWLWCTLLCHQYWRAAAPCAQDFAAVARVTESAPQLGHQSFVLEIRLRWARRWGLPF